MADPAEAEHLAALDARHRLRVAGEEADAQVRAEALRDRAHDREVPRLARDEAPRGRARRPRRRGRPRRASSSGCARSTRRSSRARAARERRARRVLRAGRHHEGRGAAGEGAGERASGSGPSSSTATGRSRQAERAHEVEHAAEARVLDRHAVARAEPRDEHALDAVERAAHDRERVGAEPVGREARARALEELGAVRRAVVEVRRADRAARRARARARGPGAARDPGCRTRGRERAPGAAPRPRRAPAARS